VVDEDEVVFKRGDLLGVVHRRVAPLSRVQAMTMPPVYSCTPRKAAAQST
jgi:hypothetical protein